jgi:TRAP-type C4-dicarboxylate transport system permease small subunit
VKNIMKVIDKGMGKLEDALAVILFGVLILCCFLQVLFRFVLKLPLAWTDEASRFVFIFLIYAGAASAARSFSHVQVDAVLKLFPEKIQRILNILVQFACAGVCIFMAVFSQPIISSAFLANQTSPVMLLPMGVIYLLIALMFVFIAIRFIQAGCSLIGKKGEEEKE